MEEFKHKVEQQYPKAFKPFSETELSNQFSKNINALSMEERVISNVPYMDHIEFDYSKL